jgi:hypothetical protein
MNDSVYPFNLAVIVTVYYIACTPIPHIIIVIKTTKKKMPIEATCGG